MIIFKVGKAMASNESAAYEIMRALDVDYVLVIFGGVIGYSGQLFVKFDCINILLPSLDFLLTLIDDLERKKILEKIALLSFL